MSHLTKREALFVVETIKAMNQIDEDKNARIKELEEQNKQLLEVLEKVRIETLKVYSSVPFDLADLINTVLNAAERENKQGLSIYGNHNS